MSRDAFTVGLAESYDYHLREATLETPLIKRGAYPGYDGGWVWPTAEGAAEFLESETFAEVFPHGKEFGVYRLSLPHGWTIDVSGAPMADGVLRLIHDAVIIERVTL